MKYVLFSVKRLLLCSLVHAAITSLEFSTQAIQVAIL